MFYGSERTTLEHYAYLDHSLLELEWLVGHIAMPFDCGVETCAFAPWMFKFRVDPLVERL